MKRTKKEVTPSRPVSELATLRGLEQIIETLRANPDIPLPYQFGRVDIYPNDTPAELLKVARAIPGKLDKSVDDSFFRLTRKFEGDAQIQVAVYRTAVCTRKEVGEEVIPEHVVPAQTVKKYAWDCPPALGALLTDETTPAEGQ